MEPGTTQLSNIDGSLLIGITVHKLQIKWVKQIWYLIKQTGQFQKVHLFILDGLIDSQTLHLLLRMVINTTTVILLQLNIQLHGDLLKTYMLNNILFHTIFRQNKEKRAVQLQPFNMMYPYGKFSDTTLQQLQNQLLLIYRKFRKDRILVTWLIIQSPKKNSIIQFILIIFVQLVRVRVRSLNYSMEEYLLYWNRLQPKIHLDNC